MNKQQILLSVAGIVVIILLFQLPKVVVDNEMNMDSEHEIAIDQESGERIRKLREELNSADNSKISVSFADSLAKEFLHYQMTDSAIKFAEFILKADSSSEAKEMAATIYYKSFRIESGRGGGSVYADKAGSLLKSLVDEQPENSSLKNKLAMTLMASENPMQGVMMLRQIIEDEPDNREALLNLGVLAVQSGQYDRAIERFDYLLKLDSTDYEATFYKAVSLVESGKLEEGKLFLDKVLKMDGADAATRAMAANYLKDL